MVTVKGYLIEQNNAQGVHH